ncbi:MAG: hypothetical protein ACTSQS_11560, partial [Promethearchaeota archaeon]
KYIILLTGNKEHINPFKRKKGVMIKMSNNWMNDPDLLINEGEIIRASQIGTIKIQFLDNGTLREIKTDDGKTFKVVEFGVADLENNENFIFSVASKRLLGTLKGLMPLENKKLEITRITGKTRFDTTYSVKQIK